MLDVWLINGDHEMFHLVLPEMERKGCYNSMRYVVIRKYYGSIYQNHDKIFRVIVKLKMKFNAFLEEKVIFLI